MNKLNIPTPTNGIPLNWDDLEFINGLGSYTTGGIITAIEGMLSEFGDNFIVQGCVLSGGNYTAGWIFLDGELLNVNAHAATGSDYWRKVTTNHADGNKQTQLSGTVDIYQINRATADEGYGTLLGDGNEPRYLNPIWNNLTLINGWSGGGVVRYRKNIDKNVQIHINLDNPLFGGQSSDIMGVLPSGYRPTHNYTLPIVNENSDTFDVIKIYANGNIEMDRSTAYTHNHCYHLPTE